MKKFLNRTILTLGLVSFFNDISSEMLYPVMPVFLSGLGYSALWIGIIEGVAEAVSGLSKAYFGHLTDQTGRRVNFVRGGYFLSSFSKPMMVLFISPLWILFSRVTDRVGKGLRTGARDAILTLNSEKEHRSKVFGFHKAMDTLGAAIGPVIALIWLVYHPGDYRSVFLFAFLPAIVAVSLTLILKEPPSDVKLKKRPGLLDSFRYWSKTGGSYRKLLYGLLLFSFFNSSDAFLLLKMKSEGVSDTWILIAYIFYNLIYAFAAYPLGALADKIGVKKVFISGLVLFILVYAGMGYSSELWHFFALFFLYGIYAGMTEGVSKAWITLTVPASEAGSATGLYSAFTSFTAIAASTAAGFLWSQAGAPVMFLFASSGVVFTALYMLIVVKAPLREHLH